MKGIAGIGDLVTAWVLVLESVYNDNRTNYQLEVRAPEGRN